jgi:hypothetical protein
MYNPHLYHHYLQPCRTDTLISTDGLTFDSREDEEYSDPVTLDTINDPVVVAGANPMMVYERESIDRWLRSGKTDPLTRASYPRPFALKPVVDLNPSRAYSHYSSFHDRIDPFIKFVKDKYNHTFIYEESIDRVTGNKQLTIAIPNILANRLFSKLIVTFDGQRNLYIAKHMNWSKTYPGNRTPRWEANDDFWSDEGQEIEFEHLSNLFEYIDDHMKYTLSELQNPRDVPCIIPEHPEIRMERERNERIERERLEKQRLDAETLRMRQERLNQRHREFLQTDIFASASSKRPRKKK